jgi:hypothetical protein
MSIAEYLTLTRVIVLIPYLNSIILDNLLHYYLRTHLGYFNEHTSAGHSQITGDLIVYKNELNFKGDPAY